MLRTSAAVSTATAVAVATAVAGACASVAVAAADAGMLGPSLLSGSVVLAFCVAGAVVTAARPHNPVGWIMLAGSSCWALGNAGADLAHHGILAHPGTLAGPSVYAVTGSSLRAVGWYLLTLALPIAFPDGRPLSRRWHWLRWGAAVVLTAAAVQPALDPQADITDLGAWQNPIAVSGIWQALDGLGFLLSFPLGLVVTTGAVVHLVLRWRRGGDFERQQLTLYGCAAALPLLLAPLAFGADAGWVFSLSALPLPVAVGYAVLARGLYDLRTAVNRTLVWTTLSLSVAAVYGLVIAGIGGLLRVRGAVWLPWVAAGVVAVGFAPARDLLQHGVNRLTFGRWVEPYDVLALLGQRLEATTEVTGLLDAVVVELGGLGLRDVAILDGLGQVLVGTAAPVHADVESLPLSAYGEVLGELRFRSPEGGLRGKELRLVEDLARHLGGVLHALRLMTDIHRAREALVLAREEERRRLRRDLHDGLGPALAGNLLRLDVVSSTLEPGSRARRDVDELRADLRATVGEVRRVVEGLRPPALDELGLAGALRQSLTRLGTEVELELRCPQLPPLSAAVEVAAFRIVSEAVTNVVRHADAHRCCVTLAPTGHTLLVTVEDDGRGILDPARQGHGMQTMRERAEELRGTLTVRSDAGGTRVSAELPLTPAPVERRTTSWREVSDA